MTNKPKFIFSSATSSFIIPITSIVWLIFSSHFTNPDGSPDNGPIRAIPAIFILALIVYMFQLIAYSALGKSVNKQAAPNAIPGALYATILTLPISIFVLFSPTILRQQENLSTSIEIGGALFSFAYLWLSFMTGALVQLWRIKQHNNSITPAN